MPGPEDRIGGPFRPPLDAERGARARELSAGRVGSWQYRIEGDEVHYVTLKPYFTCDCGDAIFRDSICKHMIAALVVEGDEEALGVVGGAEEVERPKPRLERAERIVFRW